MNKKQLIVAWAIIILFFNGCATLNFSADYYAPPSNYKTEVKQLWNELIYRLPLRYRYRYSMLIVSDKECHMKGVPGIQNGVVKIPDNYIKYMYQNYYENRFIILTCLIVHELCHTEYNLQDKPPEVHFQVDEKAISLLSNYTTISAYDYYKSHYAVKNYWFARKGATGHTLNVGWNVLQIASLAAGGPAYFRDWFAVDVDKRLSLLSKRYGKPNPTCFDITKGPEGITFAKEPEFNFFLAKKEKEESGFAAYSSPADMPMLNNLTVNGSLNTKVDPTQNWKILSESTKDLTKEK